MALFNSFIILFLVFNTNSKEAINDRISIRIPTAKEEAEYIWRNLQDIKFFEEHNYQVSYPKSALMESLKEKSRLGNLEEEDYNSLVQLMETTIYNKEDYGKGFQKIEKRRDLINKMANKLRNAKRDWNFKKYDNYEIKLTLYGSGGSYNPEDGSILIQTTKEGGFKQYADPANTLIHEIVHIGIEASIINKYQVPHALKERIVDKFVLLNFEKLLPDYEIQNMGDQSIDKYLKRKSDLKKLDRIVKEFMTK